MFTNKRTKGLLKIKINGRDRDKDLVKNGDSWPYVDNLLLKERFPTIHLFIYFQQWSREHPDSRSLAF